MNNQNHPLGPGQPGASQTQDMHWEFRFRLLAAAMAGTGPDGPWLPEFTLAPEGYGRAVLYRGPDVEIIAIRWPARIASSLHGHGRSSVWLELISGSLHEDRFLPMGDDLIHESLVVSAGQSAYLPAGALHRIIGLTDSLALHAYSPQLTEPATAPSPAEQVRLVSAWQRSTAAAGGETLPDFLVPYHRRNNP